MYTILICDDDKDIVSALDIYLTSEGYRTLKAYNGREAIQAVEQKRGPSDPDGRDDARAGRHPGHRQAAGGEQRAHYPPHRQERGRGQDPGPEHRGGRLYHQALQPPWR